MLFDEVLPVSSTFLPQSPSLHSLPSVNALGTMNAIERDASCGEQLIILLQLTVSNSLSTKLGNSLFVTWQVMKPVVARVAIVGGNVN